MSKCISRLRKLVQSVGNLGFGPVDFFEYLSGYVEVSDKIPPEDLLVEGLFSLPLFAFQKQIFSLETTPIQTTSWKLGRHGLEDFFPARQ